MPWLLWRAVNSLWRSSMAFTRGWAVLTVPVARSPWSAWPSPGASPGCAPTLLPLRETAAPPGVGGACADRRVSPHYFSPLLLRGIIWSKQRFLKEC